jgi:hypothetical protein
MEEEYFVNDRMIWVLSLRDKQREDKTSMYFFPPFPAKK